jgi:hypothetical protein
MAALRIRDEEERADERPSCCLTTATANATASTTT